MKDIGDSDPIVICGAARTPLGAFQGTFSSVPATELGAVAIRAALEDAGMPADKVDEVLMGNVLPAGLGQAPARQACITCSAPASSRSSTTRASPSPPARSGGSWSRPSRTS